MEIREMTDRQHLAYLKGRIESKLDLMSVPANEHIMDEVYHDVDELVIWLDGLIEDDMPIVVDCLGAIDGIPDITFADNISVHKTQTPVNITTPVTMKFASKKTAVRQEPAQACEKQQQVNQKNDSPAAMPATPTPAAVKKAKQKKQTWVGKAKIISKKEVLAKVTLDDFPDIPALTAAILEYCNCTQAALAALLDVDNAGICYALKGNVHPYVDKAFRRVFQFPRPIPIPSERHAEAAALGLQCANNLKSKES